MNLPTHPTTTAFTSIEDLPTEMISELFGYLPLKDLVLCSMVNKRWNSIYAAFKLQRLAVTDDLYAFHLQKWYHSNEMIQEEERCSTGFLQDLIEKPLLSNLKYLALVGDWDFSRSEFDFNKLNFLRQLLHLQIKVDDLEREINLNLPKLRVLAFDVFNYRGTLSIDCPELSTLLYPGELEEGELKVKQPETIRKLETNMVGRKLLQFKNVECLVTSKLEAISKATLLALSRLSRVFFDLGIDHTLYKTSVEHSPHGTAIVVACQIDKVKRKLRKFLNDAKKLRGNDFRFTFAGLQLTNVNVEEVDFGVYGEPGIRVCNEYVYMKNYHLIEPGALHFIRWVNYTRLLDHVTGEFPRCFSQKFTCIWLVEARIGAQDTEQLLWFLKSLRSLRKLELAGRRLSQEFYDQLPASTHSLTSLKLEYGYGHLENELEPNFDFVGNFSRLLKLEIEPALSLESISALVSSLSKLQEVHLGVRSRQQLFVKKRGSTKWEILKKFDSLLFESEDPDQIMNFFQRLRSVRQ